MDNLHLNAAGFIGCSLVIIFSGTKLTKYGNAIAEYTGWGSAWVGLILMASVTSLPELMTNLGSVTIVQQPDLAAGNVFGSCVFNLFILSLIDVRIKQPITSLVKTSHLYAGLFSIILIALSGLAIILSDSTPALLRISPFSILIMLVYLIAMREIFQFTQSELQLDNKATGKIKYDNHEFKNAVAAYAVNAVLVIGAGVILPYFGEQVATQTGLSNTFFGTLFLAAVTSMPELVVSFAAIRMASFDLLVGNLMGSNVFNIFILSLTDVVYKEPLFLNLNQEHLESVVVVILMTAVAGLGLMAKPQKKIWRLSIDAFIILLLYIGLMMSLFFKT